KRRARWRLRRRCVPPGRAVAMMRMARRIERAFFRLQKQSLDDRVKLPITSLPGLTRQSMRWARREPLDARIKSGHDGFGLGKGGLFIALLYSAVMLLPHYVIAGLDPAIQKADRKCFKQVLRTGLAMPDSSFRSGRASMPGTNV